MHPFVNRKRGVVFWWSPKCGCTTVKSIMIESMVFDFLSGAADEDAVRASLGRLLYSGTGSDGSDLDGRVSEFLSRNYIFSAHCVLAGSTLKISLEDAAEMTNVLFLRDPFQRFASGVIDKHVEGTFSRFYRPSSFLEATRNIGMLEPHHFAPQASCAFLPGLRYDRVFDIGSVDFGYLSGVLGMRVEPRHMHRGRARPMPCDPGLPRLGYDGLAALKASGAMPEYRCLYDDESLENVRAYYEEDLELIGRLLPGEAV